MNENQVIVYRSRQEQALDQWYMDEFIPFVGEHWLGIILTIVSCIFLFLFYCYVREVINIIKIRENRKKFNYPISNTKINSPFIDAFKRLF
jgi:hypothetical protein